MNLVNNLTSLPLLAGGLVLSISGCNGPASETLAQPDEQQTELRLESVTVPDHFEWSTHSEYVGKIQLVSNFSYVNDSYANLNGRYLITILPVDSSNEIIQTPVLRGMTSDNGKLVVSVTGPTPADPDNDGVSYVYKWYVDVGQGFYVDDEFAGKSNHQGNTVPASQTTTGERWKVEVYPTDSAGLAGQFKSAEWYTIGDSDNDGVLDSDDSYPDDVERAFINFVPVSGKNTLAFEDRWPHKGDYDMNDLVL